MDEFQIMLSTSLQDSKNNKLHGYKKARGTTIGAGICVTFTGASDWHQEINPVFSLKLVFTVLAYFLCILFI